MERTVTQHDRRDNVDDKIDRPLLIVAGTNTGTHLTRAPFPFPLQLAK